MIKTIILFFIIGLLLFFIICLCIKIKRLSNYSIFLENEYFNFINTLERSKDKEELLSKAVKTTLYNKIKNSKSDSIDRFKDMTKNNEFYNNDITNKRPIGF